MNYFDYLEHSKWQRHYFGSQYRGYFLALSPKFINDIPTKRLCVDLSLKRNGVIYTDEMDAVYENIQMLNVGELEPCVCLGNYYYGSHYCPCHRVSAAKDAGYIPVAEDYETGIERDLCGSIQFEIRKIYFANTPELILYSETMTFEELENRLMLQKGTK